MSDREDIIRKAFGESSRRSVLKKGGLLALTGGVLGASSGTAAAQQDNDGREFDEDLFVADESMSGLVFRDQWEPNNLFTIASPVLDFEPDVPEVEDNIWNGYNSRMIRILGTNEHVIFFPNNSAAIGPYDDNFGYVVDDDFVNESNNDIIVEGDPIGDGGSVDDSELSQLRPTFYAWNRESSLFGDSDNLLSVQFSPVPEDQEEAIWNEYRDDFGF